VATSGEFAYARRLQILHIEDNLDDAELIRLTLQAGGLQCDITQIQTAAELTDALKNQSFDLILADYKLPSFDGAAALEIAQKISPRTPFILATGSLGEELAVETLKQGATDFVLKERLARLTPAVVRAIHESQEKQNRKRAELALKESEEKYRSFVETTNDWIWSIDREMSITYSSPSVEAILGYTAEELTGMDCFTLIHSEDQPKVIRVIDACVRERNGWNSFVTRWKHKKGGYRYLESNSIPILDREKNVIGFRGADRDITERKLAEDDIREAERKYRTLVEQVPAIVYIAEPGPNGRWHYVSPRIESILGFTPAQWINDPELRSKQIFAEDRDPALFKQSSADRDLYVSEYRMYKKSGEIIWIRDEAVVFQNGGDTTLVHGLMIDISDFKNAEEAKQTLENELRQVQKIEAVGQLAGGVAHDFNNILMVISSYCELLMMQMSSSDPAIKHIQEMRSAAEKGSGLTRQLLAFSRKQRLEPTVVSLNQVISEMEGMLRRLVREDVELSIFLDETLPVTKVDVAQIERLLVNLIVNACDAMPHGGKLSVATTTVELDENSIRGLVDVKPGAYAMIRVSDTGIGMDQPTLSRIFEPFFTTKEEGKGTGLGLSTVYGIVKQSGGSIRVLSEVGKGTMFRIYFPEIRGQKLPTNATALESSNQEGNGETILLVDDNDAVRDAVASILKLKGYEVLQANNGLDAFDRINGKHGPIDLLISDVVMPVMNGRELARQLRKKLPGLKVLLMSGYSDDGVTNAPQDPGIVFISKPVQMQTLLSKVRTLLNEAATSSEIE
jgi:two-component system cell cycle sensor histidine kinase/response regulator CckA